MDVQLLFDSEMRGEILQLAGGTAAAFSARAPNKETPNEDAAAVIGVDAETGILVVADGLGGLPAGQQASCMAIRELIASIQQSPVNGPSLRAAILNNALSQSQQPVQTETTTEPQLQGLPTLPKGGIDLKEYLADLERNFIQQALDDAGGVVAHAAKRLKLRRTTLVEKMRKYGFQRSEEMT